MSNLVIEHTPGDGEVGAESVIATYKGDGDLELIVLFLQYFKERHALLTAIVELLDRHEDALFRFDEGEDDRCTLLINFSYEDGIQGGYLVNVDYGDGLTAWTRRELFDKVTTYLNLVIHSFKHPDALEYWKAANTYTHELD